MYPGTVLRTRYCTASPISSISSTAVRVVRGRAMQQYPSSHPPQIPRRTASPSLDPALESLLRRGAFFYSGHGPPVSSLPNPYTTSWRVFWLFLVQVRSTVSELFTTTPPPSVSPANHITVLSRRTEKSPFSGWDSLLVPCLLPLAHSSCSRPHLPSEDLRGSIPTPSASQLSIAHWWYQTVSLELSESVCRVPFSRRSNRPPPDAPSLLALAFHQVGSPNLVGDTQNNTALPSQQAQTGPQPPSKSYPHPRAQIPALQARWRLTGKHLAA